MSIELSILTTAALTESVADLQTSSKTSTFGPAQLPDVKLYLFFLDISITGFRV
jgi:hypothetical protein